MLSSSSDGRPFGHNIDMGRKLGGCGRYTPFGRGAGSPHNTIRPGPRPTFVPSGILIDPDVWPQQTWAEIGGELCPLGGGAGSASSTMFPSRGLSSYQVPSCKPFGHNKHGPTRKTRKGAAVIAASMHGFASCGKFKSPVTLTLDQVKIISTYVVYVGLPAYPTL